MTGPSSSLVRIFLALLPSWFSWTASQALIGWLVFEATRSPGLVSVAFALRFAPLVIVGVPIGALSDRFGRVKVLQTSNVAAALVSAVIVALSMADAASPIAVMLASAGLGIADAGRIASGTNLVYERAGRFGSGRAIAMSTFVSGFGNALGGATAGVTLQGAGPAATAALVAVAYGADRKSVV